MSNSSTSKIVFLLGSGVSIPAGMPSTQEITEQVLSGEGVMRHPDGNYYFGKPVYSHLGWPDEYVPPVLQFLGRLKDEIDLYYNYQPERCTNYEDLYYLAIQIFDSEIKGYDNPVVQPFIVKIKSDIQPLLIGKENKIRKQWEIKELADEATNYIHDIAWRMLDKKPLRLDYLGCIKDACQDSELSNVDMFTLNHDTVLEQCIKCIKGIHFTDGFEPEDRDNVRDWNPDLLERGSFKVRLFKLHGSINWVQFQTLNGDWSDVSIGISLGPDTRHTRNPAGQERLPRPMLLIGRFNKELEYTSGIFEELHYQFYRSLRQIRRLVVCGYGFGDKGINRKIDQWVFSSPDCKIAVVDPKPEKLEIATPSKWNKWKNKKRLTIIPKRIEKVSWLEIKDSLFKT